MSFSSYSKEFTANMFTAVENQFITKYLPQADGDAVRVYLYGLYLCQCSDEFDGESLAKLLKLSKEKLTEIYLFWEECDLVHVLSRDPLYVQYLPVNAAIGKPKPIRAEKYTEFTRELYKQQQKAGVSFQPHEIVNIMQFLEEHPRMEPQAFLLISEYCAKTDGNKLTSYHILNKAKKLVAEHKFTYQEIENALADYKSHEKEMDKLVFQIAAKLDVRIQNPRLYADKYVEKWTDWGYTKESLARLSAVGFLMDYKFAEMDTLIGGLYKRNIVALKDVTDYCNALGEQLTLLQKIQAECGAIKKTQNVFKTLRTWREWNFSEEMILEAAKRSSGAANPVTYINKILSAWKSANVFTLEAIPEKPQSTPHPAYRNEAAIAADERGEREHYYAVLRQQALERAETAKAKAERDPAFRNADSALKKGEIELARAEVFAPDTLPALTEQLNTIRKQRISALNALGLTEQDFIPKFTCSKCSDTGFLPDGRMCDCYIKQ